MRIYYSVSKVTATSLCGTSLRASFGTTTHLLAKNMLTLIPRYDYFPSTSRFIIRMPTAIHESVIKSIVEELLLQLRSISHGESAEFAKEVDSDGSATIDFEEPQFGSHAPDGQFRHSKANYPGVVLEVAYAQKAKDLPYLADEYILGSDGDIRVVIGISLEYKQINKATLSIWEPRIVPNDAGENELVAAQIVANQVS